MSLLSLPRSKSLSAKGNTPKRRLVLPLSFSSGQGKQTSLAILRPKEPTRAYGDHTTMEARTTWVWRDSLDGELTFLHRSELNLPKLGPHLCEEPKLNISKPSPNSPHAYVETDITPAQAVKLTAFATFGFVNLFKPVPNLCENHS